MTTASRRRPAHMEEPAPLVEIERAVQDRARDLGLDVDTADGQHRLGELVHEELLRWRLEFERGERPLPIGDADGVAERAIRNLAGYGPLQPLLDDDDVYEIMINAPSAVFVKRHSGPSGYHDEVFHDDDHVIRTLTKILDDATQNGSHRKLDPAEGLQDAQLDSGARLHIVHGDIGRDGHVIVNIRKFTGVPYKTLPELVDRGMIDTPVANLLRAAVRSRATIVFAGAPGSGTHRGVTELV